jgi:GMP synthase (glutamine-hydrolysing)
MPVVQWHFDTITALPPDADLVASSDRYEVQAFRIGEVAWGLQFHVEATPDMVAEWAANDATALRELGRSPDEVVAEVRAAEAQLRTAGEELAQQFVRLVTG